MEFINNDPKIFEKCIKQRKIMIFEENNSINPRQYSFKEHVSTELALAEFIDAVTGVWFEWQVFLDLATAFDAGSYSILLGKLQDVRIRRLPLEIIKREENPTCKNSFRNNFPITIKSGIPEFWGN